jgi:hypothetical protein
MGVGFGATARVQSGSRDALAGEQANGGDAPRMDLRSDASGLGETEVIAPQAREQTGARSSVAWIREV